MPAEACTAFFRGGADSTFRGGQKENEGGIFAKKFLPPLFSFLPPRQNTEQGGQKALFIIYTLLVVYILESAPSAPPGSFFQGGQKHTI